MQEWQGPAHHTHFLKLTCMCVCACMCECEYLFQQEGGCSEGEGPAVAIVEELLGLPGSVHHLIINTGDVQDQTNDQTETCTHTHGHTWTHTRTRTMSFLGSPLVSSSADHLRSNIFLLHQKHKTNVWTASTSNWKSGGKLGVIIRPIIVNVEAGYLLTAASCWGSLGLFGAWGGHVIITHPGYRRLLGGRDDAAPAALACSCCFVFIAVSFVNIKAYEHVNHTRFCPRMEF